MGCNVQFEDFFESYRAGEQIYRKYMDTLDPGSVCKFQPLSTTCTEKQLHVHGDSAPLSRA